MSTVIREGKLALHFAEGWQAVKWDEQAWYRDSNAQASSFRQGIDVQQAIVGCRRSCRLGQDLAQFLENLPHRSLIIKFIAAGISQGRFELELHVDQVVDLLLGNLCQFCDLIH